jgi:hypothetical protein
MPANEHGASPAISTDNAIKTFMKILAALCVRAGDYPALGR